MARLLGSAIVNVLALVGLALLISAGAYVKNHGVPGTVVMVTKCPSQETR